MTQCDYCGNNGVGINGLHRECDVEWHRRYQNGECVKCSASAKPNDLWCHSCVAGSGYTGYPGGAA